MTPYYQDDWVTLYCGDSRTLLLELPEVYHLITDAPYSEAVEAGARTSQNRDLATVRPLVNFSISEGDLRACLESPRVRRWGVVFADWKHSAAWEAVPPAGWRFVRAGAWNKTNGAPQFTGDRPAQGWEAIAILHRQGERLRWNAGGKRGVWTHSKESANFNHPTPKPIPLMQELIQDFTDPGETILDPFAGSGATLRAAKNLGRKSIGIELNPKHCETIVRRLAQEVLV